MTKTTTELRRLLTKNGYRPGKNLSYGKSYTLVCGDRILTGSLRHIENVNHYQRFAVFSVPKNHKKR
jgi:hypothetical protein